MVDREFEIGITFPSIRNRNFVGREDALRQVESLLIQSSNRGQMKLLVLYGTGGMGKTQIALEYAHRTRRKYSSIFWIDGARNDTAAESVLSSLRSIKRHYIARGLQENPRFHLVEQALTDMTANDQSSLQQTFRNWLSYDENCSWLVVIDNVDDLEEFDFKSWLPSTPCGSLIVTSRRSDLAISWNSLEINELDEQEALLLLNQTGNLDLARGTKEFEINQAFNLLYAFSFFKLAPGSCAGPISMHPLVHLWARLRLGIVEQRQVAREMAAILHNVSAIRHSIQSYQTHVAQIFEVFRKWSPCDTPPMQTLKITPMDSKELASMPIRNLSNWDRAEGYLMYLRGRAEAIWRLVPMAFARKARVLGPEHPATAGAYMGLGTSSPSCKEGMKLLQRASELRIKVLGYNDTLTQNAINSFINRANDCFRDYENLERAQWFIDYMDIKGEESVRESFSADIVGYERGIRWESPNTSPPAVLAARLMENGRFLTAMKFLPKELWGFKDVLEVFFEKLPSLNKIQMRVVALNLIRFAENEIAIQYVVVDRNGHYLLKSYEGTYTLHVHMAALYRLGGFQLLINPLVLISEPDSVRWALDDMACSPRTGWAEEQSEAWEWETVWGEWQEGFLMMVELSVKEEEGTGMLSFKGKVADKDMSELTDFAYDARRFIYYHKPAIEIAPLQVYASALIFSPQCSVVRKRFSSQMPEWIVMKPEMDTDWDTLTQTISTPADLEYASYSPDGRNLAVSHRGGFFIYKTVSGDLLHEEYHHTFCRIQGYSPDGLLLCCISGDDILILDATTFKVMEKLNLKVDACFFLPDGNRLTVVQEEDVAVFDWKTGECLSRLNHIIGKARKPALLVQNLGFIYKRLQAYIRLGRQKDSYSGLLRRRYSTLVFG
ncbi:eukaryotic translation initiation factor 3 [Fusarium tjaetaba]|uniref:Eukaryotic translation initiation factor 3 n=1 Tax=Fusarium tjaetaba TaxID=1567544 RepID=A0A8H5QTU8_9HYPO|nr:eukaryotic translation initiation factor 3 [Fusarium tjaetaba]KAF5621060.1 eukaryotic translation initiation factor 3 [Fusarium tjaetaba]